MMRVALAVLAGCGTPTPAPTPTTPTPAPAFETQLDRSVLLTGLTETQVCTLQEDLFELQDGQLSFDEVCMFFARAFSELGAGTPEQNCTESLGSCEVSDEPDFVCDNPWVAHTSCTGTIEDFAGCAEELTDSLQQIGQGTCADPVPADVGGSAICTALQDDCNLWFL